MSSAGANHSAHWRKGRRRSRAKARDSCWWPIRLTIDVNLRRVGDDVDIIAQRCVGNARRMNFLYVTRTSVHVNIVSGQTHIHTQIYTHTYIHKCTHTHTQRYTHHSLCSSSTHCRVMIEYTELETYLEIPFEVHGDHLWVTEFHLLEAIALLHDSNVEMMRGLVGRIGNI